MPKCKQCNSEVNKLIPRTTKCPPCNKQYQKEWREKNQSPERRKKYYDKYYSKEENRKKLLLRTKKYREEKGTEWIRESNKKSYQKHKHKRFQYYRDRRKNDLEFRIIQNLRTRIWNAVNDYQYKKKDKTIEELGCSIQDFFVYLGQQFTTDMNWDNYGVYWEIDHTIPLSKGGSFHYTNTKPMTISANRSKGNRI